MFGNRQWHRKQFKSGGAQFPAHSAGKKLYCAPPLFSWCPGHYIKVQGTVTRTERYLTFQCHAVSKVTSPTDRTWVVLYRYSISCSVSKILHVNLQTYFGQLRGTSAHTLVAGVLPLERLGHQPNISLLLPCVRCVQNSTRSYKPFGHNTLASHTDRPTDDDKGLTLWSAKN